MRNSGLSTRKNSQLQVYSESRWYLHVAWTRMMYILSYVQAELGGGGDKMTCSTSVQYLLYGAMDQHIIPLCKETKWNILFRIDCLKFHQPPENMISVTRLKKRNWNIVDFYRFLTASVRLIKFCSYRRLINNS